MRESIGSVSIFAIVITFIMLITAYLAISVNYAKAFRIKNHIINMIEENHGIAGLGDSIDKYLVSQGYTARKECPSANHLSSNGDWETDTVGEYWELRQHDEETLSRYCIYRIDAKSGLNDLGTSIDDINKSRAYYKVVTFFKFDIPVIGNLAVFNVSGDSELIYGDNSRG